MTDTYEFLKAQKDAILAKKEADENEWLKAAAEDIAHYKQERDLALAECERLKALVNTALDDLNAEAEAFRSLENAQANFSNIRHEVRAYGIATVKASKSSKALRDAARAKP